MLRLGARPRNSSGPLNFGWPVSMKPALQTVIGAQSDGFAGRRQASEEARMVQSATADGSEFSARRRAICSSEHPQIAFEQLFHVGCIGKFPVVVNGGLGQFPLDAGR